MGTEKESCNSENSIGHFGNVLNIITYLRIDGKRSEEFERKVGVHQGSVLSPLLFAIVMDEIAKELLDADDFLLLGNSGKR